MTVDFLHNQIIRDTVTPIFIESFNENLLPKLALKYGDSLEAVQFYDNHIADGFRIGGIFYYPLTLVISGTAKTEWISWQVSNYRIYDSFNPFSYKGQELLSFSYPTELPEGLANKILGKPIYCPANSLPIIMQAMTDNKTFLAGKYSQGFIDLMVSELTDAIEKELAIVGLAESGVTLEMNFAPGTYMEHISKNSTYRRLRIKARACSARDFWIKWTRLDGKGTYTISDNVDRSMISFEIAENVPGKIKETEYRYLASKSAEEYRESMSRKNITEWREMMRRVLRRGEVEKIESEPVTKKLKDAEEIFEPIEAPEVKAENSIDHDDITERLNALLSRSSAEAAQNTEATADSINSDLADLLKEALGFEEQKTTTEVLEEAIPEATKEPEIEAIEETTKEPAVEAVEETTKEPAVEATEEPITAAVEKSAPLLDENEVTARIRKELEEKMRAEIEELRRKNAEAEAMREHLEAQRRAEAREKELLAEAARLAVLDNQKREADRRAEAERDRLEAERRAEEERAALEREREKIRREEAARIEAEMRAAREREAKAAAKPVSTPEPKTITKTVSLIFRRGGADKDMIKKIRDIIVLTVKRLGKESVYMKIKAANPDPTTLTLTFSDFPKAEEKLIVDIIQVLGRSGLGITKATME